MKRNKITALISVVLCMVFLFSGCITMEEPNDLVYVIAIGIDAAEEEGTYHFTIQFAKPIEISGGGGEEGGGGGGGKKMMENLTFTAPTIYAAVNLANQYVSKKFTLAHAKLIVFSREIAEKGVRDFMETIVRNMEIRPNIYMAVSLSTAKEYLTKVDPLIEADPVKYYQLIYENNYSIYTPNNVSQEFYFSQDSSEGENVLPIANIVSENKESGGSSEGSSGGGSSGQQPEESSGGSSGGSSEGEKSGESEGGSSGQESGGSLQGADFPKEIATPIPMQQDGFEYHIKNYVAGDIFHSSKKKSEILGMAVFDGDRMIGMMGSVEAQLYNLLKGSFYATYMSFQNPYGGQQATTVRVEQERKPKFKIDLSQGRPMIHVTLYLEGEFYSLPADYILEEDIKTYEMQAEQDIENAEEQFLYKTSRELHSDIVSFGSYAKRKFLTYQSFQDYNWKEQYKNADFDVEVKFSIKRSGLIIRSGEE